MCEENHWLEKRKFLLIKFQSRRNKWFFWTVAKEEAKLFASLVPWANLVPGGTLTLSMLMDKGPDSLSLSKDLHYWSCENLTLTLLWVHGAFLHHHLFPEPIASLASLHVGYITYSVLNGKRLGPVGQRALVQ